METPTAFATAQTQIGVAIEAQRGVAPASPKFWIPVLAPKYKPDLDLIDDKSLQGSMVEIYDSIPGLRYDSHGWNGYPFLDSFPVLLRCELGSTDTLTAAGTATSLSAASAAGTDTITTTVALVVGDWVAIGAGATLETHEVTSVATDTATLATPLIYSQSSGAVVTPLTVHEFSLLNGSAATANQPPTATIWDFDGQAWRQLSAAQLDKLTIKATAKGLVDYDCSWFANPSVTPSAPTPSYTTTQAIPGWTTTVSVGGTLIQYLVDWQVDLARKVTAIPAFTGTQNYMTYFAGPIEATAKVTYVEQSGAPQLADYLAGTVVPVTFTVTDPATGDAMQLHATSAKYRTGDVDRSKVWVETQLDVQLLPSATDALAGGVSPLLATVANTQTTSY